MSTETPPGDRVSAIPAFLTLVRRALRFYVRNFGVLMSVTVVRLLPFYLLIWYFPISDGVIQALIETMILVPTVAALIRYVWAATSGIELALTDAVLGPPPSEIMKLLGTNLFIVAITILFAAGGQTAFFTLAFIWGWVTLVSEQVVIIEGSMLVTAIRRSFSLVQARGALTVVAMVLISIPEIASMAVYQSVDNLLVREAVIRGITILVLPFSALFVTMLYEEHLLPAASNPE